jgi:hypothetical protein
MPLNRRLSVFVVSCALVTSAAEARVVRLVVDRTTPLANGASFGSVGPYERLDGTVFFEVDPRDPLNAVVVNLDKAPRNDKGLVEFSAPFVIIKPVDPSKGNSKILYGINNRGNNIEIPFQTLPAGGNNLSPDAHDGLLYRLGYTFVDAGWAGDITTTPPRVGATLPVALGADGKPIVAPIRIEYTGTGFSLPLKGNALFRSYETADTDTAHATLTVRDAIRGAKTPLASDRWAYGKCPTGRASLEASAADICLFDGFQANRIYELIYPATKPWVMGLGFAITRDLASFLRFDSKDASGQPNPVARLGTTSSAGGTGVRRVYGLGISSTGMYLREFLYLGFNEDEAHRKVFDAVRIMIPGTHRLFMNVEFADPNVYSRQDQHSDFLSHSLPPFTYAVTTDPLTGVRDGILKRPATDPLVFHVDTANEFWQMNASLNVHDGRGQPVPVPETVRYYFAASHSHIGASGVGVQPTATGTCAFPTNGNLSYNSLLRALIVALDDWADRGVAPPPSRYPSMRDGTLVRLEEAAAAFPRIPAVPFPTVINVASALDFGPKLTPTGGALVKLPPARGAAYPALVPKPDADGLDLGGIRTLDVAVPIGTNTGWNLWAPGPRGADLCGLQGSFFPFSKAKADREGRGDPRPSLEERYRDHAGFVAAVERAARQLVAERFLLAEDAKTLVATAEASDVLR